jgi:hypothetical protein
MKKAKHIKYDEFGNNLKVRKVNFWYVSQQIEHPEGICISLYSKENGDKTNEEIILPLSKIKKLLKGKL